MPIITEKLRNATVESACEQSRNTSSGSSSTFSKGQSSGSNNSRRINANAPESVYQALEGIAQRRGKSVTQVLQDAVATEQWIEGLRQEGAKILVERDGKIREVVLRR